VLLQVGLGDLDLLLIGQRHHDKLDRQVLPPRHRTASTSSQAASRSQALVSRVVVQHPRPSSLLTTTPSPGRPHSLVPPPPSVMPSPSAQDREQVPSPQVSLQLHSMSLPPLHQVPSRTVSISRRDVSRWVERVLLRARAL
jgi:hypothetical protein